MHTQATNCTRCYTFFTTKYRIHNLPFGTRTFALTDIDGKSKHSLPPQLFDTTTGISIALGTTIQLPSSTIEHNKLFLIFNLKEGKTYTRIIRNYQKNTKGTATSTSKIWPSQQSFSQFQNPYRFLKTQKAHKSNSKVLIITTNQESKKLK